MSTTSMKSSELAVGMIVRTHGLRVQLVADQSWTDPRTGLHVASFSGVILNREELLATGDSIHRWLVAMADEVGGRHTVQGNDLAPTWHVETASIAASVTA